VSGSIALAQAVIEAAGDVACGGKIESSKTPKWLKLARPNMAALATLRIYFAFGRKIEGVGKTPGSTYPRILNPTNEAGQTRPRTQQALAAAP